MKIKVYDNEGQTIDRYTVIINDYDVFTMSINALSPSGYNQYYGKIDKYILRDLKGKNPKPFRSLPKNVLVAIIERCLQIIN